MKENLFKVGVSDWKLEFENDIIVDIATIVKDSVSSSSDGKTEIVLENARFTIDVLELFRNKVKLISLNQWFRLVNSAGEIKQECEYNYFSPKIKNISYAGVNNGVSIFSLTIECI